MSRNLGVRILLVALVCLWAAAPARSADPIKLNGPLVAGGTVSSVGLAFSPDGSLVLYQADQDVDNDTEIFSVPSTGGISTKLNGPLPANGDGGGRGGVSVDWLNTWHGIASLGNGKWWVSHWMPQDRHSLRRFFFPSSCSFLKVGQYSSHQLRQLLSVHPPARKNDQAESAEGGPTTADLHGFQLREVVVTSARRAVISTTA